MLRKLRSSIPGRRHKWFINFPSTQNLQVVQIITPPPQHSTSGDQGQKVGDHMTGTASLGSASLDLCQAAVLAL